MGHGCAPEALCSDGVCGPHADCGGPVGTCACLPGYRRRAGGYGCEPDGTCASIRCAPGAWW